MQTLSKGVLTGEPDYYWITLAIRDNSETTGKVRRHHIRCLLQVKKIL